MSYFDLFFTNKPISRLTWLCLDAVGINVAFGLAYWMRYDLQLFRAVEPGFQVPYSLFLPFVGLFTVVLLFVYYQQGVYHVRRNIIWLDDVYTLLNSTATGTILTIVIIFLYQPGFYSRLIFIYAAIFVVILLSFTRLVRWLSLRALRRRGYGVRRVLIVGSGELALSVMRTIVANPEFGLQIVGFLEDTSPEQKTNIGRFKALGTTDQFIDVMTEAQVDEVIITLPWQSYPKIMQIMAYCEHHHLRARIVPDMLQMTLTRLHVADLAGIPMIGTKDANISGLNQLVKRLIDIALSVAVLITLSPLFAIVATLIRLESAGPIFFSQFRVGKDGREFRMYKFRSMVADAEARKAELTQLNEADGPLFKIKADPRITRVGKWIRKYSVDELPQLYNVLRGDMSLIGPRPALPNEVAEYQDWHLRRLEASPGITGLGQISGRSELSFDETVLLDIYYIENWSFALDTKILLKTVPRVLSGRGAY